MGGHWKPPDPKAHPDALQDATTHLLLTLSGVVCWDPCSFYFVNLLLSFRERIENDGLWMFAQF